MLLTAIFVLLKACTETSSALKGSNDLSFQESKVNISWQDDVLLMEERGGKKCKYKGVSYTRGQTILKPRAPNYDRCENCTCVRRGRFGKCKTVYYCDAILACDKEDYVFPEDDCCPVCKKTDCGDLEEGQQWQKIKEIKEENPLRGICTICECKYQVQRCSDNEFICRNIPDCLETEMKPGFCCPECKTWAKPTTEPLSIISLEPDRGSSENSDGQPQN